MFFRICRPTFWPILNAEESCKGWEAYEKAVAPTQLGGKVSAEAFDTYTCIWSIAIIFICCSCWTRTSRKI